MVHASGIWQKGNAMQVRTGFTTQQLNMLCQYSYGIGRGDAKTRPGLHWFEDPALGSYWVLRSRYCPENGFEGMIAAQGLENGPDYAHLIVVYAGTNLRDDPRHDIHAALTCFLPPLNGEPGQTQQAGILARQALDLARRKAGTERGVLFTGHSLGGGLALIQAAAQKTLAGAGPGAASAGGPSLRGRQVPGLPSGQRQGDRNRQPSAERSGRPQRLCGLVRQGAQQVRTLAGRLRLRPGRRGPY